MSRLLEIHTHTQKQRHNNRNEKRYLRTFIEK